MTDPIAQLRRFVWLGKVYKDCPCISCEASRIADALEAERKRIDALRDLDKAEIEHQQAELTKLEAERKALFKKFAVLASDECTGLQTDSRSVPYREDWNRRVCELRDKIIALADANEYETWIDRMLAELARLREGLAALVRRLELDNKILLSAAKADTDTDLSPENYAAYWTRETITILVRALLAPAKGKA